MRLIMVVDYDNTMSPYDVLEGAREVVKQGRGGGKVTYAAIEGIPYILLLEGTAKDAPGAYKR